MGLKSSWNKWKPLLILIVILLVLAWAYSYFNGGSTDGNLMHFLETDGLKGLIVVVVISIGVWIFKKLFKKAPIHR